MITIPTGDKWTDEQIAQIDGLFQEIAQSHPGGLVRMKFTDAPAPWNKGDIAGLEPANAAKMFRYELAFPCKENGEPIDFSGVRQSEQAPAASSNEVPIPPDWEDKHHLQQIRLAKEITGRDESMTLEQAKDVVRAELQRRGDN